MNAHVVNVRGCTEFDVYIGRGSPWGNPFSHVFGSKAEWIVHTREKAIEEYGQWLYRQLQSGDITLEQLAELDGKVLGCYCKPRPCHGDVLVQAAAWATKQLRGEQNDE